MSSFSITTPKSLTRTTSVLLNTSKPVGTEQTEDMDVDEGFEDDNETPAPMPKVGGFCINVSNSHLNCDNI